MTKILHKIWHEFLKALFWMWIAVCFPDIIRESKRLVDEGASKCEIRNEGGIGFKY